MEYACETHGNEFHVQVSGRMTHADHRGFRGILNTINEAASSRIVFDLGKAEFLDSSALGMLLIVRDAAVQQERVVVLKGASGQVEKLIAIGKLHKYFEIA
jgi:anti-anti-sigma factor